MDLGNVTVRLRFDAFFAGLGAACVPQRGRAELLEIFKDPGFGHGDYERGLMDGRAWHALLRGRLGLGLDYEAWLRLWQGCFEPNTAMEALLTELRGQTRLWGLSNTNADHLRHLKLAYPVLGAFEGVTASCEVGALKPEAAIYAAALQALGLDGPEVLYLDDIPGYVRAAEACGIRGFHYTFNDAALRERLVSLGFRLARDPGI
jgi:putative hydrolase of the HAD superfamily